MTNWIEKEKVRMEPNRLQVNLTAVTPLFIGGAEPNKYGELRPPSFKGLLRYWYRAIDHNYRDHEKKYFGSTDKGQSPCLLQVHQWTEGRDRWEGWREKSRVGRYHRPPFPEGKGRDAINGIAYLGYSLALGANDRRAIPPDTVFNINIIQRPCEEEDMQKIRRAWLAGLWLLVHIGGIGSRSRRGLGSLKIEEWGGWAECAELPLACHEAKPENWVDSMYDGLKKLREWFPNREPEKISHTVVNSKARFLIMTEPFQDWEKALHEAGTRLQTFRRRSDPDYSDVKAHLAKQHETELRRDHKLPSDVVPTYLSTGPTRAGFGLPLSFRYQSLTYTDQRGRRRSPQITFVGIKHERMASPLFIRIVQLDKSFYPVFVYLTAPFLSSNERIKSLDKRQPTPPWEWHSKASGIVHEFLDNSIRPNALEVNL
jgi:CRISPR-associated protein Cmr1